MEIIKARHMGFCFGVRRAIEMVERAAAEHGQVRSLGAIVHNRQVVERLAALGVGVVRNLDGIESGLVAVTSHGAGPEVAALARERGLAVVDATCPFVRKVQQAARSLAEAGFYVLIFGESTHPEVRGILGWVGERGVAARDVGDLGDLSQLGERVGVVSQTTQNAGRFTEFVKAVVDRTLERAVELRVANTICSATSLRQQAALDLARQVDLMLVIGGRDSANTRRLAETCALVGVETHHIETAADLNSDWVAGRERVGVTAGASTPDSVIDEVEERLLSLRLASPRSHLPGPSEPPSL